MINCRVCKTSIANLESLTYANDEANNRKEKFAYFRCTSCGCFQIKDIPADLSLHYGNSYYSFSMSGKHKLNWWKSLLNYCQDYAIFFGARNAMLLTGSDFLYRKWPTMVHWRRRDRILDVGCGAGDLLRRLYALGFQNLTGIDPFIAGDIEIGSNAFIKKATVEQIEGSFDRIILSHSLEHMSDQHSAMESVCRLLSPTGKALVFIPIFSQYFFDKYGAAWYSWDAPRHLYLHSVESFRRLAESSGLVVEQVIHYSFLNCLLESERRLLRLKGSGNCEQVKVKPFRHLKMELARINKRNLSDCCNFVLRRK